MGMMQGALFDVPPKRTRKPLGPCAEDECTGQAKGRCHDCRKLLCDDCSFSDIEGEGRYCWNCRDGFGPYGPGELK